MFTVGFIFLISSCGQVGKEASGSNQSVSGSTGSNTSIITYSISPVKSAYIPGDIITITATSSPNASLGTVSWGYNISGGAYHGTPKTTSNTMTLTIPFTSSGFTLRATGTPRSQTVTNGILDVTGNYSYQIPINMIDMSQANVLSLSLSAPNGSTLQEGDSVTYSVTPNIADVSVGVSGGAYTSLTSGKKLLDAGTYTLTFSYANKTETAQYSVTPADIQFKTIQNFSNLTSAKLAFIGSTPYLIYSVNNGSLQLKSYNGSGWVDQSAPGTGTWQSYRVITDSNALYLAYTDASLNLTVKKFQEGSWSIVGNTQFATAKTKYFGFCQLNGILSVGYVNTTRGNAKLMSFINLTWTPVASDIGLSDESDNVTLGVALAPYSSSEIRVIYASSEKGVVVCQGSPSGPTFTFNFKLGAALSSIAQLEADQEGSSTAIGVLAAQGSIPVVYEVSSLLSNSVTYTGTSTDVLNVLTTTSDNYAAFDISNSTQIKLYKGSFAQTFGYTGILFPQSGATYSGSIYIPRYSTSGHLYFHKVN